MGVASFAVLPNVSPLATVIAVIAAMLPCLIEAWLDPQPKRVLEDIAYMHLCGFMFGKAGERRVCSPSPLHFLQSIQWFDADALIL